MFHTDVYSVGKVPFLCGSNKLAKKEQICYPENKNVIAKGSEERYNIKAQKCVLG